MMTSMKEIRQEFNAAKRHFNRAIELAKKSIVVGEVNFPGSEKKAKVKKANVTTEPEGKVGT